MKGKIVLIPFPFTDLTDSKVRPALVLYDGPKDVVVLFISSRIPLVPSETDVVLKEGQPGFAESGLKLSSVIKLNKIATLLKELVVGELGFLEEPKKKEVNTKLSLILKL